MRGRKEQSNEIRGGKEERQGQGERGEQRETGEEEGEVIGMERGN